MKYDKMVAITQAESQRKMNIAKNTISDMLKNMERITVAELVKRTGLSRGFFYKNELIRREMDDAIHRQEAIFKNRHPVAMDRKLENSVIELKIELLKAKAENEKLAEQNQELNVSTIVNQIFDFPKSYFQFLCISFIIKIKEEREDDL